MKVELKNVNWKDLETKGYLVVKNAFDSEEISELINEFSKSKALGNDNYNIPYLCASSVEKYRRKFSEQIIPWIKEQTNLKADYFEQAGFFATSNGVNFDWHIDPESFYISQDHYHYLNFYLPIKKPIVEKSNLSLIPADVLSRLIPDIYNKVVNGRGALRLLPGNGKSVVVDDNDGRVYECNFAVKDLIVTPQLGVGDLLVMRGDLFHKTQDKDTDRVNVSFRFVNSNDVIELSHFDPTCLRKAIIMSRNRKAYYLRRLTFDQAGKTSMSQLEHYKRFAELVVNPPKLPDENNEAAMIQTIGEVLQKMPVAKVVIIENCADQSAVQSIFNSSNSLGAHLLIAHEKASGLVAKLTTDRALDYIIVKDLAMTLEILKQFKLKLIGLQGNATDVLSGSHLSTHTAIIVNGDNGILSKSINALCDNLVCASLAYGRVLPLHPPTAVACALMKLSL